MKQELKMPVDPGPTPNDYIKQIKKINSDVMRLTTYKAAYEEQGRGRADIASAGKFGKAFIFQFHAKRQRKVAGRTVIRVWSTLPFFEVFEKGNVRIHGDPLLWIPISSQAGKIGGTPAGKYPGRLFELRREGRVPLLMQREGKESIPKFFGIESVLIPKKFHITEITEQVTKEIPGIYSELMKGYKRRGRLRRMANFEQQIVVSGESEVLATWNRIGKTIVDNMANASAAVAGVGEEASKMGEAAAPKLSDAMTRFNSFLKSIGRTGGGVDAFGRPLTDTFAKIGEGADASGGHVMTFTETLRALGRAAQVPALGQLSSAFRLLSESVLGWPIVAGIAVAAMGKIALSAAQDADKIAEAAAKVGMSVQKYQAQLSAGAVAGIPQQQVVSSIEAAAKAEENYTQKVRENAKAYEDAKLRLDEFNRSTEESRADRAAAYRKAARPEREAPKTEAEKQQREEEDRQERLRDMRRENARQYAKEERERAKLEAQVDEASRAKYDRTSAALAKLGVPPGLTDVDQTFEAIAAGLDALGPGLERVKIEEDLVAAGISNNVIPVLEKGVNAWRQYLAEGEKRRPAQTPEQQQALSDFQKSWEQLKASLLSPELATAFSQILTPALQGLAFLVRNVVAPSFEFIANTISMIAQTGGAAFNQLIEIIRTVAGAIGEVAAAFAQIGGDVWNAVSTAAVTAFTTIVDWISQAVQWISNLASGVSSLASAGWEWLKEVWASTFGALIEWCSQAAQWIGSLATRASELIQAGWEGLKDIWNATFGTIVEWCKAAVNWVGSVIQAGKDLLNMGWEGLVSIWNSTFGALIAWCKDVIAWIDRMIQRWSAWLARPADTDKSGGGETSGPVLAEDNTQPEPAMAAGGMVRGPGTGTSDSILGWLSAGEFVQPAAVVQHYGLAFMESLRRMQLPSDFLDMNALMLPHPRLNFATGGEVAAPTRIVNLTIDGQTFNGLSAPEATAQRLIRYALSQQIKRAGRKPSWVG